MKKLKADIDAPLSAIQTLNTIGSRFANQLTPLNSLDCNFLIKPLVLASESLASLITAENADTDLSEHRDELLAIARIGQDSGSIHARESQFVHNLIQLHSKKVSCIITPRPFNFGFEIVDETDHHPDMLQNARNLWHARTKNGNHP